MKVHEEHKHKADNQKKLKIALIIVSTSKFEELKSQKETSDETIPLVQGLLHKETKISLKETVIVPDSAVHLEKRLNDYLEDENIAAIIYSGGTGLSPKDITYETIKPKFEKIIPGFGELFRYLSYKEIGSSAMLSRAIGGKIGNKAVFLLPGSPNAVKLALTGLILPELAHMTYLITKKE
ncbi:MAG: molybdenum cofactor biosynthesis protein [Candidatus Lokiarchaeota archaeon]|nr:molybdenum cofactor biosynthesis protein [Candidatus Lokiarchaeota archaeon]MBD3200211.1 molybdenum cofactor biosynthesis protein [Candidatus Lokiarchaeota archaeon]